MSNVSPEAKAFLERYKGVKFHIRGERAISALCGKTGNTVASHMQEVATCDECLARLATLTTELTAGKL